MRRLFAVLNPPLSEGPGRVVQFISAQPGEGTSTIARAFARAATLQSEQYVMLLDLNTTGPSQHDWFQQASHEDRSEEHTSELQSLMRISYAVFCLQKKTNNT